LDALLNLSSLRHNAIEFNKIKESDFIPALDIILKESATKLEAYKKESSVSFHSVIEVLSEVTEQLDHISSIFYMLYSAHATDALREVAQEFSQKITAFSNQISMDEKVFERVKALVDQQEKESLTSEQHRVLDKTYSSFVRNGALLNDEKKKELKAVNEELSNLSLKFSDNLLKSMNELFLHVKNEGELTGLSKTLIDKAQSEAKERELEGYVFTLQYPSYLPFMKSCSNRKLRKEFSLISTRKGRMDADSDNAPVIKREIELRIKRANLLGFEKYCDYVLDKRMAKTEKTVRDFIENISTKAMSKAKEEFGELKKLAKDLDGIDDFSPWDQAYYCEVLKKKTLDFDDELLRPFLKCENVVAGLFEVANRLYDLTFKEVHDLPKYHEKVQVFEAYESGEFLGLFYMDLFPRKTKKSGAWMTNFIEQGLFFGEVKRPHVGIVCNFTQPSEKVPSLLTLNEVLTLFHEFGHALHGLMSKCRYRDVSGTSVYWDFVELPSQIMENWVGEKECLSLFAVHYETGEKLPEALFAKIKESQKFLEGLATVRQLSFAELDMNWHSLTEVPANLNVEEFEKKSREKYKFYDESVKTQPLSFSFGHLFAGGYSSGYYSYKWAEVLDADAFELFLEKGIFNKEISNKFKQTILEKGDSQDPMALFEAFRGRKPEVSALLKRAGL